MSGVTDNRMDGQILTFTCSVVVALMLSDPGASVALISLPVLLLADVCMFQNILDAIVWGHFPMFG